MQLLYDSKYEKPPAADRLRAMIRAIASGGEIDAAMRAEIVKALKSVEVRQANDETRKTRGRTIALETFMAASLAKKLIDTQGIKSQKRAVSVATEVFIKTMKPKGSITDVAVERCYRKLDPDGALMTGGSKLCPAIIPAQWISDAMSLIPGSLKSGNK